MEVALGGLNLTVSLFNEVDEKIEIGIYSTAYSVPVKIVRAGEIYALHFEAFFSCTEYVTRYCFYDDLGRERLTWELAARLAVCMGDRRSFRHGVESDAFIRAFVR